MKGDRSGHGPWSVAALARPVGRGPGGAEAPKWPKGFIGGDVFKGLTGPGYTLTLAEAGFCRVFPVL